MKKYILIILFFITCSTLPIKDSRLNLCSQWAELQINIRDRKFNRDILERQLKNLNFRLINELKITKTNRLYFPIKRYAYWDAMAEGYKPQNYNFLDANNYDSHPAVDIFVNDKNRDCLDDETLKPIQIVAIMDGWIIGKNNSWTTNDISILGGNYLYLYAPVYQILIYYAHLNKVYVNLGEKVMAGQIIGTLGRTGKNAFAKRSSSHLHFSMHVFTTNYLLIPINPMPYLKKR